MPHMGHADSVTNDEHESRSDISDRSSSNPITRVIKVHYQTPTISLYEHSFIHAHIHSFHMQLNASHHFMLRHEAVVASFNMSNDRLGFEGWPTMGTRPPRIK